jgi:hypothetical protein
MIDINRSTFRYRPIERGDLKILPSIWQASDLETETATLEGQQKMTTSLNTTPRETGIQNNRSPENFDSRAYVYWRPGQAEGLMAVVDRHRASTGWAGYIIVKAA